MRRRVFLHALRDGILILPVTNVFAALSPRLADSGAAMSEREQLRLFLAGDVMTGRGVDQVLAHPGSPALHEDFVKDARRYVSLAESRNGPIPKPADDDYIWGEALAIWREREPDLRIVNLETSITTSDDYWPGKAIHYRMHPDNVGCLTAAAINCCVLANNHVLDWGYAGLDETLATLHGAGIATAGAGHDVGGAGDPARLPVPGKGRVLVFAFADESSGVPARWSARDNRPGVYRLPDLQNATAKRVAARIAAERRPDDIVVASIHWGANWGYPVPTVQRSFAHALIDSDSVDVVFGHSSHHAKAVECYRGKVILYGTGDFVTDYEGIGGHERYRPWLSGMYFLDIEPGSRQVQRLEILPLSLRRFQLASATSDERRWLCRRLNESSRDFATVIDNAVDHLVACAAAQ